jgi:uncharacterized protein (UPF0248 family)
VTPIQDLLHRIRWDPVFGQGRFEVAYVDHAVSHLARVPFEAVRLDPAEPFGFDATESGGEERFIPFHRVRKVYRDGEVIWQRTAEQQEE